MINTNENKFSKIEDLEILDPKTKNQGNRAASSNKTFTGILKHLHDIKNDNLPEPRGHRTKIERT